MPYIDLFICDGTQLGCFYILAPYFFLKECSLTLQTASDRGEKLAFIRAKCHGQSISSRLVLVLQVP